jgi:5-methylcytosine-specific restriction endonuclease McrA
MAKHGERRTEHIKRLYDAQGGRCFHCGGYMVWGPAAAHYQDLGWTREHVYPKTGHNRPNNIVLAHSPCNSRKGSRLPTPAEIEKTVKIYAVLGIVAFKRPLRNSVEQRTKPKMALKPTPDGMQWIEVTP